MDINCGIYYYITVTPYVNDVYYAPPVNYPPACGPYSCICGLNSADASSRGYYDCTNSIHYASDCTTPGSCPACCYTTCCNWATYQSG